MQFFTLPFVLFIAGVFLTYWIVFRRSSAFQNLFILLVNLVFYGLWNWRWIPILLLNSLVSYGSGLALDRLESAAFRRTVLVLNLTVSVGILLLLKYYGFFAASLKDLLELIGLNASMPVLRLMVPVGISFYTLMILSYPLDVYFRRMESEGNIITFLAFSSFFPLLAAGPIERARHLLPQFRKRRRFHEPLARNGLRMILWGLLLKMVVADNLAAAVDDIFVGYQSMDGITILFGVLFFTVQIYCDFAGYSYVATGTAGLLGIKVMKNFSYPYFSRDISEFWRRWHISLSTWFRDYIFMPFCGDRPGKGRKAAGILFTFTISGLWHGASWTFVLWGLIHGTFFLPRTFHRRIRPSSGAVVAQNSSLPGFRDIRAMLFTFFLVAFAWILFRAPDIPFVVSFLGRAVSHPFSSTIDHFSYWPLFAACSLLFAVEWFQRRRQFGLDLTGVPVKFRWTIYYVAVLVIIFFGSFGGRDFIYVKF